MESAAYGEVVGDSFQTIADIEAVEAEAPALAASVIGWLAGAGIIAGDPADFVLGTGRGYPPGPHYAATVTRPDRTSMPARRRQSANGPAQSQAT